MEQWSREHNSDDEEVTVFILISFYNYTFIEYSHHLKSKFRYVMSKAQTADPWHGRPHIKVIFFHVNQKGHFWTLYLST